MVSTIPSAVSGLTKEEAPSAGVVPGGNTRHCTALMQRYCEYMAPPRMATVFPISACAAGDAPAWTTTPAPSLPTGSDCSRRPAIAFITAGEMLAVTAGLSAVPDALAVLMSAPPKRSPWSEGLMGAAPMRTMTSSGLGSGVGTLTSESWRLPSCLTVERSCSPVLVSAMCRLPLSVRAGRLVRTCAVVAMGRSELGGRVPRDTGVAHDTHFAGVVRPSPVQHAAVVPDDHVAGPPLMSVRPGWSAGEVEQV